MLPFSSSVNVRGKIVVVNGVGGGSLQLVGEVAVVPGLVVAVGGDCAIIIRVNLNCCYF